MLKHIFPLIETLQFLNELRWELMVAKTSFHLQVEVLRLIMCCDGENRRESCGPNRQRPLGQGQHLKQWEPTTLDRWWRASAWAPAAALSSQATKASLLAQGYVRERSAMHLASRKINSLENYTSRLIGWVADISIKLMHERILNGNSNILHSPDAVLWLPTPPPQSIEICLLYLGGYLKAWWCPVFPNVMNTYIYIHIRMCLCTCVYMYVYLCVHIYLPICDWLIGWWMEELHTFKIRNFETHLYL